MDETSAVATLHAMRSEPMYQAAEMLRRNTVGGAAVMAASSPDSQENRAVTLLISTWDNIAAILRAFNPKDHIFRITPLCHMYEALEGAITILQKESDDFGAEFATQHKRYKEWLATSKKDAKYVSAACSALYARFG